MKKYITCEGRYTIVYTYDFVLLSHLRHGILVSVPYYILKSLQNIAHCVRSYKYPQCSLTNHGFIKLIILRELHQRHQSWVQLDFRRNPMAIEEDIVNMEKKRRKSYQRKKNIDNLNG